MSKAWFILPLIIISSCGFFKRQKDADEDVVARVEDVYLYKKDLEGIVLPGTSSEDSIQKVSSFVDAWVRQMLLLKKAELNLTDEMKTFDQQLENYRRSLIIYSYQELLVSQRLDTSVTDDEIGRYYEEHQEDFQLRKNILKATYVVFSRASKERDKVRKWFTSDKEDQQEKFRKFCRESALKYNLNDTSWMYMDVLEKDVPVTYSSQELFLSSKRFVEFEDSLLVYMLKIHDYKIKESLSPLEFEKSRISGIILNIRKRELLQKAEEDIYHEGIENKKFEVYTR